MRRDSSWVKSRIAARLLLRQQRGPLTIRDEGRVHILYHDPSVTDRLMDQALASLCAEKKLSYESVFSKSTVEA